MAIEVRVRKSKIFSCKISERISRILYKKDLEDIENSECEPSLEIAET